MAKAIILQARSSPASAAILADLGWLLLSVMLECIRVRYFHPMKFEMSNTRLCQQIFD